MSTAPKITREIWNTASCTIGGGRSSWEICNKANEIALAEQQEITAFAKKRSGMEFDEWQGKPPQQESEYITAEEAQKLGAGAEYFAPDRPNYVWVNCGFLENFLTTFYDGEVIKYRAIKQAQPVSWNTKYIDSTPKLSVGNSAFEDWFQAQEFATLAGVKQMCRDSYAAGMGDPLVTYAATQAQPEPVIVALEENNARIDKKLEAFHKDEPFSPELEELAEKAIAKLEAEPVDTHADLRAEYAKQPTWTGSRDDVIALLKEKGLL